MSDDFVRGQSVAETSHWGYFSSWLLTSLTSQLRIVLFYVVNIFSDCGILAIKVPGIQMNFDAPGNL